MKRGLDWKEISRSELAEHLQSARIIRSQAVGDTNLYHCIHSSGETIAVALPNGNGLLMGMARSVSPTLERRKRSSDAVASRSGK